MSYILFDPVAHTYTRPNKGNYTPVSKFIGRFQNSFEEVAEYWAYYKAVQYCSDIDKETEIKKYNLDLALNVEALIFSHTEMPHLFNEKYCKKLLKGLIIEKDFSFLELELEPYTQVILKEVVDVILEFWETKGREASSKGTVVHKIGEDNIIKNKGIVKDEVFYKYQPMPFDLNLLESTSVYPELILYNDEFRLCGTADRVFITDKRKIIIEDDKTSEEIVLKNSKNKFKAPIEKLHDCNFVKFSLQLSCYAYMLEAFGHKIEKLEVHHIRDGLQVYNIPYLKKEIEAMLTYN